jgi:hypothetical protein
MRAHRSLERAWHPLGFRDLPMIFCNSELLRHPAWYLASHGDEIGERLAASQPSRALEALGAPKIHTHTSRNTIIEIRVPGRNALKLITGALACCLVAALEQYQCGTGSSSRRNYVGSNSNSPSTTTGASNSNRTSSRTGTSTGTGTNSITNARNSNSIDSDIKCRSLFGISTGKTHVRSVGLQNAGFGMETSV